MGNAGFLSSTVGTLQECSVYEVPGLSDWPMCSVSAPVDQAFRLFELFEFFQAPRQPRFARIESAGLVEHLGLRRCKKLGANAFSRVRRGS